MEKRVADFLPARGCCLLIAPAYCHHRLPMDKITHLDASFRYLRAVCVGRVMQRGLSCYRH